MTLTDGVKKLRTFMGKKISKRKAARDLDVSLTTIIDWLRGAKTPTPLHRRAIAVWTDGAVVEADWVSAKELKALQKSAVVAPYGANIAVRSGGE